MDQDKQTLLEAAKALVDEHTAYISTPWADLRAAIAREESRPPNAEEHALVDVTKARWRFSIPEGQTVVQALKDRAQQAEADAKWHREESARLSAELAKERKSRDAFRNQVDALRDELQVAPDETTLHAAKALRQRAELAELDASTEREITKRTREYLGAAQDQTTWIAAAAMRERAEKAEAELAKLIDMKVNPVVFAPEPSKVEMQTHAFGSNAVGGKPQRDDDNEDPVDPMTGWTFATYRRVVEALGGKS